MALIDTNTPYEILIRFGYDGLPKGAHAQYLRRVILDDEVLKEEIGDAVPLDIVGFPTSTVMTDTTRDALAEITRLNEENAMLAAQLNAASAMIAELTAQIQGSAT